MANTAARPNEAAASTETAAANNPNESSIDRDRDSVFGDILCAVDGTAGSYAAVEQAAVLAGPGGRLTLLAVTSADGGGASARPAVSPGRAELILDRAAQLAEETGGVRTTKVAHPGGSAIHVLLDRASQHDLLAIGAPVVSRLGGLFVSGVADEMMGSFTTPLLAARPAPGDARFAGSVLVASEGSEDSDRVVEFAARLASSRQARVTLVHAVGVESRAGYSRPIETQKQALERAVGGVVEVLIEAGSARRVIVETAQNERATLIVMGSHRLSGLHAIGSVSRRVLHDAPCSVLLVPPEPEPSGRGDAL